VLLEQVIKKIEFELEEINSLFELYKDELLALNKKPNLMEVTAFAGVRHTYSFRLDWEEMEDLIKSINYVWRKFKSEIAGFLKRIRKSENST
jgi:hypothetical protein